LQNNVDIARDNYLDALDREIKVQQELKDVAQDRFDLLQNNVDIARDNYLDALDREIKVQQELKDVADDTANSLFNIIESLGLAKVKAADVSNTKQWNAAIGSAMSGDMAAMSSLSNLYSGVLDEALAGASSREEYQDSANNIAEQLSAVQAVAKKSMKMWQRQANAAQKRIDLLTEQSNFIQGIDNNILSLSDAQEAYNEAMLTLEQSGLKQQISLYEAQLSELQSLNDNVLSLADARMNYASAIANAAEERGVHVPAFGAGGTVSAPTFALVGESGVEHITPDSQMTGVKKELAEIKTLLVDIARGSQREQRKIYELLDDVVNGYSSVNTEAVTA
jgi:hypothetical protein